MRPHETYFVLEQRRRREEGLNRSFRRRLRRFAFGLGAFLLLALAGASLTLGLAYADLTQDLPSLAALPAYFDQRTGAFLQPTRFYDRSGQHVLRTLGEPGVTRRYLPLQPAKGERLSPALARLVVAIYDPGFRSHAGLSTSALLDPNYTPATLAERLASDLLLDQEPTGLRRSLRTRLLAAQLTTQYGRDQVLEWYLNSVYLGHLAYGADAAAQTYLGVPASRLDLAQAALLASLIQTPALNPLDAPEAARENQLALLDQALGRGAITAVEYQAARTEKLVFRVPPRPSASDPASAFVDLALSQAASQVGMSRLERGGLEIKTTLDYDLQLQMDCAVRTQVNRLAGQKTSTPAADCPAGRLLPTLPSGLDSLSNPQDLSASAVVLDPASGQVLALVGETNAQGEVEIPLNHPGGSLLSPFIYLFGFTRGLSPASLVWDLPPAATGAGDTAGLSNLDGSYHGPMRLRTALANDYWAPAENLLRQIGVQNVWRLTGSFGLAAPAAQLQTSPADFPSAPMNILDAAQAYGVFANQGILSGQNLGAETRAYALLSLKESGTGQVILDWSQAQTRAVLSPPLAYLVNAVLSDESARWPSLGYPNALEIGRPAGAHLGRTADGSAAWAAGYTPQRVVVVWLGANSPAGKSPAQASSGQALKNDPLPRLASDLWHALVQYALRDLPTAAWMVPPGVSTVEVCDPSGLLPTADCPAVVSEVFLNGNEPTGADTLYQSLQINRETGRLATVFTPPELVENRVYLVVPPDAEPWARAAGLPVPPKEYDIIQAPPVSAEVHVDSPALFSVVRGKVEIHGTASGDGFSFYRVQVGAGLNPQRWLQLGQDVQKPVQDGLLASWDTSGDDGLYALRLLVIRQDQRVETATLQVTVDNQAPEVKIVYPAAGEHIAAGQRAVTFQSTASDNIALAHVDWYLDGKLLASQAQEPFTYPWQPAVPGKHTLQAKAFDRAGNQSASGQIEFIIDR